ncbi:MAG TPA: hypothetical protein VKS22_11240 [Candidatus Binataceae bacterium]|nr:hypothetical protein [Candidatus Binataceae bacterium]
MSWRVFKLLCLALTTLLVGCAETPTQRANRIEPMLAASGFRLHPADTPERLDDLKWRPALKVRYSTRNGKIFYWFADPTVCRCLYVGSPEDYQKYEELRLQQQTVEREESAAEMNEDAALQERSDFMMWPMW